MVTRALLFDLDGTVWDSAPAFARAVEAICGIRAFGTTKRLAKGESIVALLGEAGVTKKRFINALVDAHLPALYPGIEPTLRGIKQRGLVLGVVTSLPGSIAMPVLEAHRLTRLFSVCIDAARCRVPKPSPTGLRMALREIKLRKTEQAFYIGDRKVDYLAAARAEIGFGWVAWGYEPPAPRLDPNIKILEKPATIGKL